MIKFWAIRHKQRQTFQEVFLKEREYALLYLFLHLATPNAMAGTQAATLDYEAQGHRPCEW